jgi:hypothetical protein
MGELKGAFNEGLGKGLGYALGGIFFLLLLWVASAAGVKLTFS